MNKSLVIGMPVALRPAIMVAVAMEAMAVVVAVAVVVKVAAEVAVAAVIMDREVLVHQPRTRQRVLSMAMPTPRARSVDGTVATVPINQAITIYPA